MADEEDVKALRDGEADLVRRDFRSADLRGLVLRGKDFSGAHFEQSNFSRSDLTAGDFTQAHLSQADFSLAVLANANFQGAIVSVNFTGADLRGATFSRSVFARTDFTNADLRGADFTHTHIQEGNKFEGAVVDETTKFDGANVLRAIARQDAFRYYSVDRGVLVRVPEEPKDSVEKSRAQLRDQLVRQINSLTAELQRLEPAATGAYAGLGHNNPPEGIPLDKQEHETLQAALVTLKEQATTQEPDASQVKAAQSGIVEIGAKIMRRLASHADTAAEEFAKGLGKNLSDPLKLAAAWTLFSGGLSAVIGLARSFFGT